MKNIMILSRSKRLDPLFSEMGNYLADTYNHKIIVTLGDFLDDECFDKDVQPWLESKAFSLINIPNEMQKIKSSLEGDLLAHAHKIEHKLGITLYKMASCYFLLRKFYEEYNVEKWSETYPNESILIEEFVLTYHTFDYLFEKYKIDLVFCETPDTIMHRIAQAVAYQRDIFQIGLSVPTFLADGARVFTIGSNRAHLEAEFYYKNLSLITSEDKNNAQKLIDTVKSNLLKDAKHIVHHRKHNKLVTSSFINYLKAIKFLLLKRSLGMFKRIQDGDWLVQHCKTELPKSPYVVFFMHYQPESATCMVSSRWCNQDLIIEQLSLNAPAGMTIVVKENPKQFGTRGKNYYGKVARYPNVYMLDPRVSNDKVIQNCAGVVLISGNIAIQCIAYNKPLGVLSNTYYSIYKNVKLLEYPEQIYDHIKRYNTEDNEEILSVIAASIKSAFYTGKQRPNEPWPENLTEGGKGFGEAVNNLLQLIERHQLKPNQFNISL